MYFTATRNTVRCCGFYRVPHRRLWRRNSLCLIHPHRRCSGGSIATDTAMPRPARSGTHLVAASAHRRMLDHSDLQIPAALPNGFSASQQCSFGQVHGGHMVTVSANLAPLTPRGVVAAGAREWFVAARTPRGRSACRYGHHRRTDTGGGVRESGNGLAAGRLRGPIVVDAPVPAGFEGAEVFHRDHRRPRRGSEVGNLGAEVKRHFPVDLPPLDTHRLAVRVEDGDLRCARPVGATVVGSFTVNVMTVSV